jgi:DNA mismatch endonuclease (patch repair protein)
MADPNASARSEQMRLIRSKNTKPEIIVRKLIYSLGFRYRLHSKSLPGHPDVFFPGRKKAIFVHGCFWHRHTNCRFARLPKSRLDYWLPKLERNRARDLRHIDELKSLGWGVLVVWECETKTDLTLSMRLNEFLSDKTVT